MGAKYAKIPHAPNANSNTPSKSILHSTSTFISFYIVTPYKSTVFEDINTAI